MLIDADGCPIAGKTRKLLHRCTIIDKMSKTIPSKLLPAVRGRPRKRGNGEDSRIAILDAALVCIARNGLAGASHRVIAEQAGVTLSLTTYFFSSRDDILLQAFDHFAERTLQGTQSWLSEIGDYLLTLPRLREHNPEWRNQIADMLAERISEFITRESPEKAFGNAIEVTYMFAYQQPVELRQRVKEYRAQLVAIVANYMIQFGMQNVEVNASLLLGTVHRWEYECLNTVIRPSRLQVRDEIAQLLRLMLKD